MAGGLFWRIIYAAAISLLFRLIHNKIGSYSAPLPGFQDSYGL
jgi:hypothetical protein